jgi:hypothetical protein
MEHRFNQRESVFLLLMVGDLAWDLALLVQPTNPALHDWYMSKAEDCYERANRYGPTNAPNND